MSSLFFQEEQGVLLLTLFIYEKIQHRPSILEASLALYRNIHETKASCEAETLRPAKKNPHLRGDFSKEFFLTSA